MLSFQRWLNAYDPSWQLLPLHCLVEKTQHNVFVIEPHFCSVANVLGHGHLKAEQDIDNCVEGLWDPVGHSAQSKQPSVLHKFKARRVAAAREKGAMGTLAREPNQKFRSMCARHCLSSDFTCPRILVKEDLGKLLCRKRCNRVCCSGYLIASRSSHGTQGLQALLTDICAGNLAGHYCAHGHAQALLRCMYVCACNARPLSIKQLCIWHEGIDISVTTSSSTVAVQVLIDRNRF